MLLMIGLVLGLAVGAFRKGSFFRLGTLQGLWFAVISLVMDPVLHAFPDIAYWPKAILTTACYLCVLLFIVANRSDKLAAGFLATGTLCNYAVRAANAFRMPVSVKALDVYIGISAQEVFKKRADYFIADGKAKLLPLGDIIYLPFPGMKSFISVGDIFLSAGVCLLVISIMGQSEKKKS